MDGVAQIGNVVVGRSIGDSAGTSVPTIVPSMVAACCSVEPHLKLVAAVLGQFEALRQEHLVDIVTGAVAPVATVQVPR